MTMWFQQQKANYFVVVADMKCPLTVLRAYKPVLNV